MKVITSPGSVDPNLSDPHLLNTNLDEEVCQETRTKLNGNHEEIVWKCDHHCCLLDRVSVNILKEIFVHQHHH